MSEQFEMADDDRAEIVEEFLSEAEQYLQVLNDNLLKAEDTVKGGGEVPKDDMHAMFRAAHTIKGTASFLDFKTISTLTHEMETILDRVRNDEMVLTVEIIDVLFSAFDGLNGLLDRLRSEGNDEGDVSEAIEKIKVVLSGGDAPAPAAPAEEAAPAAEETVEESSESEGDSSEEDIYMAAFIEDCEQNIERFITIILAFEKEEFNPENISELFRIAHTLKGSAGVMKLSSIESVAHNMEDVLSEYREKQEQPNDDTISLLFKGIDKIKEIVDQLQKGESGEADVSAIINEFKALNPSKTVEPAKKEEAAPQVEAPDATKAVDINLESLGDAEKTGLKKATENKQQIYRITVSVDAKAAMKSMKAMVIQERITKLGSLIKAQPNDSEIDDSVTSKIFLQYICSSSESENEIKSKISVDEVNLESIAVEDVTQILANFKEPPKAVAAKKADKKAPAKETKAKNAPVEVTTMRIDTRKLDNLMNLAGELVITRSRFSQLVSDLVEEVNKTKEMSHKFQSIETALSSLKMSVRDCIADLDAENKNSSGEPDTNGVGRSFESIGHDFLSVKDTLSMKEVRTKLYSLDEAMGSLEKLSSDIQNGVMATRMVQIEGVFTRFKRLVRDISKEVKKDVKLDIFGEETELDKKIVDELGDPLTHMVRNAIDHGLETPDEREVAGKERTGTVTLGASHKGNNIVIEIADDGKGLDPEKIAAKGIEKGIITEEQQDQMSDREKLNLIFAPGFSTAAQVTGLSGRGVGMDVVKKMIESLNGTVDIESELGKGTTFKLKIPLTLAIIQALLVVVNKDVLAIPLESVSEIIKISNEEVYTIEGNETIKLREHALSMVRLGKIIQIREKEDEVQDQRQIVVVTDGEQLVGIPVDRLIGEDEIVIKSLPDHFANVIGISGASILGDGSISLILDIGTIIRAAQ